MEENLKRERALRTLGGISRVAIITLPTHTNQNIANVIIYVYIMHDRSFICVKRTEPVFVWYNSYKRGTRHQRMYGCSIPRHMENRGNKLYICCICKYIHMAYLGYFVLYFSICLSVHTKKHRKIRRPSNLMINQTLCYWKRVCVLELFIS